MYYDETGDIDISHFRVEEIEDNCVYDEVEDEYIKLSDLGWVWVKFAYGKWSYFVVKLRYTAVKFFRFAEKYCNQRAPHPRVMIHK